MLSRYKILVSLKFQDKKQRNKLMIVIIVLRKTPL
jgi:hypothetical protein